ncbi:protease complex subunit PrcB family protein [Flavobacterium turcicum]|uniref:Protease complex subunit PrcB family protein n=1 Tax=Flavobacterium turcicum TaxID=2764718 RepID=A0ABR7JFT6_9FLAO|nr:protease complex subunit PrcB family protein [Flavobacterium turcicum]MBC5863356.1 protease complex subunit PrcB family protein [Flavobacterium turcicum]NHL02088.1 protease complex subunit PrcB family protein [Flavobacterium turcicum]
MKRLVGSFIAVVLFSCGTTNTKNQSSNSLYEVLTQQSNGGAAIRFFEILTAPNEITMLQNDELLKNKVTAADVQRANFVILNLGEKSSGGYSIGVENVVETDTNIIVTVKEQAPEPGSMVIQSISNPFCVLKINSKKPILFK